MSAQLAVGNLDMVSMAALQQEVNALKREILRKDKKQVRTNKLLRSNGTDEKGRKWLEVLNRVNKLDNNKLEMESQCSVSDLHYPF